MQDCLIHFIHSLLKYQKKRICWLGESVFLFMSNIMKLSTFRYLKEGEYVRQSAYTFQCYCEGLECTGIHIFQDSPPPLISLFPSLLITSFWLVDSAPPDRYVLSYTAGTAHPKWKDLSLSTVFRASLLPYPLFLTTPLWLDHFTAFPLYLWL